MPKTREGNLMKRVLITLLLLIPITLEALANEGQSACARLKYAHKRSLELSDIVKEYKHKMLLLEKKLSQVSWQDYIKLEKDYQKLEKEHWFYVDEFLASNPNKESFVIDVFYHMGIKREETREKYKYDFRYGQYAIEAKKNGTLDAFKNSFKFKANSRWRVRRRREARDFCKEIYGIDIYDAYKESSQIKL